MNSNFPDSKKIIQNFYNKPSRFWDKEQESQSLQLFNKMSRGVEAYKKFLKTKSVSPNSIKTFKDFQTLPSVDKQNYFNHFHLSELAWKNAYTKDSLVMTATSGSTGLPTYFPRNEVLEWQYSVIAEFFLKNGSQGNTLLINCFGMGVWIGGLITYQAFRYSGLRGYPVTIITPGVNKKEIFHALRNLTPNFKNVILAGYPPFIKDLIDESGEEKIIFNKKFHTRLLFAAESFSERFRDYLAAKTNIQDVFHDTLNIYGSAELGAMAFETPLSILLRRIIAADTKLSNQIFIRQKTPTLAQFYPAFTNFEHQDGQILITADSACPMVRYKIGDTGKTFSFDYLNRLLKENGVDIKKQAKKLGIKLTKLPFVAVYERNDFSTKLYGAIIYPEHVREALQSPALTRWLTGKFTMATITDKRHNQSLLVNAELKKQQKPSVKIQKLCEKMIIKNLLLKNAEYKNNYQTVPRKVAPKVMLWPHGHPKYFITGVKQKWIVNKK